MAQHNPVTPHFIGLLRRTVRESRKACAVAREAALRAGSAYRAAPNSGRALLDYEDAIGAACEARFWLSRDLRRLSDATARGIEKGANVSPRARERAIASGRWRP